VEAYFSSSSCSRRGDHPTERFISIVVRSGSFLYNGTAATGTVVAVDAAVGHDECRVKWPYPFSLAFFMEQLGLVVKKERSVCKFQSWGLSSIRNTFIFEIRTKKVIFDLKIVTGAPLLSDVLSMVTYSDK
jgi:hypothetical protein